MLAQQVLDPLVGDVLPSSARARVRDALELGAQTPDAALVERAQFSQDGMDGRRCRLMAVLMWRQLPPHSGDGPAS
ncbi:hypothetical protein SUDANB1_02609 [Streptomyces sp. enrichment culture]|uniref:hypothetical protein n=1 Tax=Streptomyces sp. enrichment culture TaxID=1795815 RepID=UPI003F559CF7